MVIRTPPRPAPAASAGMASRTNTFLSIPMLFFMAAATHFPSLGAGLDVGLTGPALYWLVALVVIGRSRV